MSKVDPGVARADRRLWCSVVIQAAADMDLTIPNVTPSARRPNPHVIADEIKAIREEARKWFLSTDRSVGSFGWICDTMDLDYYKIQSLSMTREGRKMLTGDDRRMRANKEQGASDEELL
jgi:hypothetical protein